jgi:hypothetical protein
MHDVDSIAALAGELLLRPHDIGGFRTLVTGSSDAVDVGPDAVQLVKAMAEAGADVMLVEWTDGARPEAEPRAGLGDLMQGRAKFEDVVTRVPASGAHLIPAGTIEIGRDLPLDPDQVNLTLDALDTAYDHIVVVARNSAARALFEAIQGRFDAGVLVVEGKRRAAIADAPSSFLGFEVTDIELFRLERPKSSQAARDRLARLTRGGSEARAS